MIYPRIEKPTEPGWYWWRRVWPDLGRVDGWIPVQMWLNRAGVIVDKQGMEVEADPGAEWRGPIQEPTE